jgi:transcriptional regulator with XRE-family HTH domain
VSQTNGIGARLRAARERAGLSREALAFHSGVSWSAIAQVESGRRTNLRPRTLSALARALGVTIDYLVAGHPATDLMFEHRALLYDSHAEFLASAVPFLAEAPDRSEAALVVTSKSKIASLRKQLGTDADAVEFADRSSWYRTPTGALDGYRAFLDRAADTGAPWVRILGEPVWTGRSDAEIRLWARYESFLNLAFSSRPLTLLCAYDRRKLDAAVIGHARATHPRTLEHDSLTLSSAYCDPATFLLQL